MTAAKSPVTISYYSDILCIWAYIAERRLTELRETFTDELIIDTHFIPLFGDTQTKFAEGWKDRGGVSGYADHVHQVADGFDHISLHPDTWTRTQPLSSAGIHLVIKAAGSCSDQSITSESFALALRQAFFEEGRDIARLNIQMEIFEGLGGCPDTLDEPLQSGAAFAALCRDSELQQINKIEGSPTYLLNHGRQKLYGNVGFKVIRANVQELLKKPNAGEASWC